MRKLFIVTALLLFGGIAFSQNKADIDSNKKVAVIYHELDPNDIDDILAVDFIGHTNEFDWTREAHQQNWSNNKAEDKIIYMVAENDMVAVKFRRMWENEGKSYILDMMQFIRFKDGKIAEIWEIMNPAQLES
jgi:hypothetical protein